MAGMIGILGGTFDPPHMAHLILAEEARDVLLLDEILWIPTANPPHKPDLPITAVEHREEMVRLTIQGHDEFTLSRVDIERPGPHYSLDTVRLIKQEHPQIAFLMGADSLDQLTSWHEPQALVDECDVLGVMKRPGITLDLDTLDEQLLGLKEKTHVLEAPIVDLSSKEIRRRIRAGLPYQYLLPPGVAEYIQNMKLYR
jgi:nicotinate-nucleotide adenylyltransferase